MVDPQATGLCGAEDPDLINRKAAVVVGVAVIGAGHWGPNLIRNFYGGPSSRLLWVVDLNQARLQEVKERFAGVSVSDDPQPALRDPAVDAVVVATPTSTHYPLAKRALEEGKHVLVEKPLATSVNEAEELCELADSQGRVLMVGHVFVHNRGVQEAKRYIDAGELGPIYYISMVRTNLGPIRMDVNAAWDLASHDVSIANYWLGSGPVAASAVGGTWINPGVEDAVFSTLRYPGNILVNIDVSWLNPRKTRDITVIGDRRMLTLDDMNLSEPLRIYDKGVSDERTVASFIDTFASFRASVREGSITIPQVTLGEPLRAECEHFIECIEYGKRPLTGGPEGLAVVQALEAMTASMQEDGRSVKVGS